VIRAPGRDELREHLTLREIETAICYPLGLHEQECLIILITSAATSPEPERAARETLALPIYPEISSEAQSYVVNSIAKFSSNTRSFAPRPKSGVAKLVAARDPRVISTLAPGG
jgi:dTDP-4-amino-4,6-dideoxygalactose transaminase